MRWPEHLAEKRVTVVVKKLGLSKVRARRKPAGIFSLHLFIQLCRVRLHGLRVAAITPQPCLKRGSKKIGGMNLPPPDPRLPAPRLPIPNSRSPPSRSPTPAPQLPIPAFPLPNSRSPTPDPQLPIPAFPIPDSRSPTPDPQLPIPNSRSPTPDPRSPTPAPRPQSSSNRSIFPFSRFSRRARARNRWALTVPSGSPNFSAMSAYSSS